MCGAFQGATLTNNSPKSCDYPHFTDEGTKAQRKKMTSLSAQIRERWMDGRISTLFKILFPFRPL